MFRGRHSSTYRIVLGDRPLPITLWTVRSSILFGILSNITGWVSASRAVAVVVSNTAVGYALEVVIGYCVIAYSVPRIITKIRNLELPSAPLKEVML